LKYTSGAYVGQDLKMNPVNNKRTLRMIFQRQYKEPMVIELEFLELIKLNLSPDIGHTCEIFDVSMFWENGNIYWGDSEWFKVEREKYEGTWLYANGVRWRIADEYIENKEVY